MMWQEGEEIHSPTDAWKSINITEYGSKPFRTQDLFGEGETVHEFAKLIKRILPQAPTKEHTVDDWKRVYLNSFNGDTQLAQSRNGEKLRESAVRMEMTSPFDLFKKEVWEGKNLRPRHDTKCGKRHMRYSVPHGITPQKSDKQRKSRNQVPPSGTER